MVKGSPSLIVRAAGGELTLREVDLTNSAPATHGLPMPRATTAACDVRPPRDVSTPSAAIMPCTSSGFVSIRTRMTFSPFFGHRLGAVGVEHRLAVGRAG